MLWLMALLVAAPETPSCGVTAALALSYCVGRPVSPGDAEKLGRQYPQSTMTLLQVRDAAQQLGVQSRCVRATFEEVARLDSPAVLHLREPEHFVTVLSITDSVVHCVEQPGGRPVVLPSAEVKARYTGVALVLPERPEPSPRAVVPQVHWTVDAREAGQEWVFEVAVRNGGRSPLTLRVGGTTCTCTSPLRGELVVAPGGTEVVPVKFRLTALRPVEQAVWFATDDPGRPVIGVSIAVRCEIPVRTSPSQLSLAIPSKGTGRARLVVTGPAALPITAAEVDSENLEVRLRDQAARPPYLHQVVEVATTAGLPVGEHRFTLTLKFAADDAGIRVPVIVTAASAVAASPRRVVALDCPPTVPFELALTSLKQPFELRSVTVGDASIREVSRSVADDRCSCRIGFVASLQPGQVVATEVVVATDLPGEPPLRLPVTLRAAEAAP
ncbi:MAG: hypothetical protein IT204_14125 [Fimbriimonadaceae bacterium]|nr:hypothetical protein [Fimbriimonadaceae bacterium]